MSLVQFASDSQEERDGRGSTGWMSQRWLFMTPILLVVAMISLASNFKNVPEVRSVPLGGDLLQEWVAGRILLSSQPEHIYELDYFRAQQHDPLLTGFQWKESSYFPPVYPPLYYLVMSPLAFFEYPLAIRLWALVSAVLLVAVSEKMSSRFLTKHQISAGWVAFTLLVFMPVWRNFLMGQKGTLILLLFSATYLLLKSKRSFAAGMVFGLLLFKPHLSIVLLGAMFWKRQWAFCSGWAVTAMLAGTLSWVCCGWNANAAFLQQILATSDYVQTGGYQLTESHHWWGVVALLLGVDSIWTSIGTWGAIATTVWLTLRILKGEWNPEKSNFDLKFASLCCATVLLSPHFYSYDLVLLLLPFWLILRGNLESGLQLTGFSSGVEGAEVAHDRAWMNSLVVGYVFLSGMFATLAEMSRIQTGSLMLLGLLVVLSRNGLVCGDRSRVGALS